MKKTSVLFLLMISFSAVTNAQDNGMLHLPAIFSDDMVLQQNSEPVFWGNVSPNSEILIQTGWNESVETKADDKGYWSVKIPTPEAGGPYSVIVNSGSNSITFNDVLIGEVWLCSGQSNMEMPLRGWPPRDTIANSEQVIQDADNPKIRLFTVARAFSNKPENDLKGEWVKTTPETAADFSAAAYFFGKKLFQKLQVPIGLIHSSWGGTPVESWTGKKYLEQFDDYKSILENLDKSGDEIAAYKKWLHRHDSIDVSNKTEEERWKDLSFYDDLIAAAGFDDSKWETMKLPALWENSGIGNFDGVVWFRKTINIPDEWAGQNIVLELGPIDDMDRTYVNGKLIGATEESGKWEIDRIYNIPSDLLNGKKLTVSVRVLDNQGGGGIYGKKEKLNIHPEGSNEKISLAGQWKYLPVAEFRDMKFYLFDPSKGEYYDKPDVAVELSAYTPTALFNAMINPLVPFTIRGAIWYQGESNTGEPQKYGELFSAMINNWRDVWGLGNFPFYYVQIAPWDYGENTESQKLREAQLQTLSVPNTGMAVTLDIGDVNTIHPADKKDVGYRLANWALAKTYDYDTDFSGPLYESMEVEDGKAIISFDYAGKLVYNPDEGTAEFLIAGKDRKFRKANVEVKGNKLILSNPEINNPVAVRYAWSNTATATLFDENGLPASSFRTDDW